VDGARYTFVPADDVSLTISYNPLNRLDDIKLSLSHEWKTIYGKMPLKLTPGRHVIRFLPEVHPLGAGWYLVHSGLIQAISNPVEFDVTEPDEPAGN
jgi:hypothetical protein